MTQPELDFARKYPDVPGYKRAGTSSDAATATAPRAPLLRDRVLKALANQPMTPDECAAALGESILSIRPRFTELQRLYGLIEETGERRCNASGLRAAVWRKQP